MITILIAGAGASGMCAAITAARQGARVILLEKNDIDVNPVKEKKLTNMRSATADKAVILAPYKKLVLEETISYINDDEFVEVTPSNIKKKKKGLTPNSRKR